MNESSLATQAQEAQRALDDILGEVENLEGYAAGEAQRFGGDSEPIRALHSIKDSRVNIGDPRNNLTHLTPKMFGALDLSLSETQKRQIADKRYDFYYMTVTVGMMPFGGAHFNELWFEVDFNPLDKDPAPIVQSIFPVTSWRTVAEWGAQLTVGIDANGSFKVGVNSEMLTKVSQVLEQAGLPSAEIQENVVSEHSLKGLITVPEFKFAVGRFEIAAAGTGQSSAQWQMSNADLPRTVDNQFIIVLKVPAGQTKLPVAMYANARVDFSWLGAQLSDVTNALSEKVRCWVKPDDPECQERKNVFRLGVVAEASWGVPTAPVPRPALKLPE